MVWERVGDSSCNRRLDLSSGSVGGVVARHLFDEMPDHQDATTGGVLRITVSHVLYPVTKEVLHQILEGYGVEKMSVFERVNHVEAMVQLRSWQEAKQARDAFHGRCIYEGCCFLDILLEPPRPDSASTTTARRDAEASAIAPEVVVADACSSPSDKQAEPWPEEPKQQQPAESQSQETRNQNDEPSKPNEPAEKPGPDNAEASAAEPSSPQPSPEPKKSADETPKPVQESREASNAKANADANANGNTSDETKAATGQQSNEAKGLLLASIRDPNPVIFFEPNGCTVCLLREVPEEDYMLPLSQAEVIRKGGDITLIGWGAQLVVLELACEDAAKDGSSCELIYLKTLIPWDKEIVEASVSKTGKLLVSHEASITGGFGAEPTSLLLKILSGHALQRPWDPGGQDIAIASVRGIKTKDSAVVAHNSEFYIEIKNLNTVSVQQSVVGNEIPVEIPGLAEPKVSLKLDSPDECSVNVESNNTDMVDSKSDKTSSYGELIGDLNASSLRKCSPFISDQESQSTCSRKVECFMEDSMDALHIMSKVSPSPEVVGSDNVESETVINSNTKFALIGNELKIIHTENTTRECTSQNWPVLSKASRRVEAVTDSRKESADAAPVIVPRTTSRMEMASDSRREPSAGRVLSPFRVQSRYTELQNQISALGMQGQGRDAIAVFNELCDNGFDPDDICFVSVLNACSHTGLLDEGRRYFQMMKDEYHIILYCRTLLVHGELAWSCRMH